MFKIFKMPRKFKLTIKVNKGSTKLIVVCNSRTEIKNTVLSIKRHGIMDNENNHFTKDDIWNICCRDLLPLKDRVEHLVESIDDLP